ncbi:TIGR01777 family oxidoreductase [Celerinatantimonas yamalensis]|uniref:TIGR01777 family oxidoreductase n=1 Tax=Celerinatantimonas yamalensis TaxID=559956 RepID=A0ABW9G6K4_9GAMM
MRIFITGGSGFIGSHLIPHLLAHGHQIVVFTRHPLKTFKKLGHQIDVCSDLNQFANFDNFDAVINLAGEPIASGRWSSKKKQQICHSRWQVTEQLCQLITASKNPPQVFLSGSAVGFYGDQHDQILTEQSPPLANDFSHQICAKWELNALKAQTRCRVCLLRTGLVLGHDGGMLKQLLPAFRLGLGGVIGSGTQYQPWIHMHDMVRALEYLLNDPNCQGAFNLTAPAPVTNAQFTRSLAKRLHRPAIIRVPQFALKLALGEMSQLLLGGQRAIPEKLRQQGFQFMFKQLDEALIELLNH